jgi:hypothetical protein
VHLVVGAQPAGDDRGTVVEGGDHLLCDVEVEDVGEEPLGALDVVTHHQGVIKDRSADADEVTRERVGVVRADLEADRRHRVVQLDDVAHRDHDPDAVADLGVLAGAHALDGVAESPRPVLVDVDLGRVPDLDAEALDADATLLEDEGVVVPLVPAREVELAVPFLRAVEAQRVGVVLLRLSQVGDSGVHVAQSQDGHCPAPSGCVRSRGGRGAGGGPVDAVAGPAGAGGRGVVSPTPSDRCRTDGMTGPPHPARPLGAHGLSRLRNDRRAPGTKGPITTLTVRPAKDQFLLANRTTRAPSDISDATEGPSAPVPVAAPHRDDQAQDRTRRATPQGRPAGWRTPQEGDEARRTATDRIRTAGARADSMGKLLWLRRTHLKGGSSHP